MTFNVEGGFNRVIVNENLTLTVSQNAIITQPNDSDFFQIILKLGKYENIGLDVNAWLSDNETLTAFSVSTTSTNITLSNTAESSGLIAARVTGDATGQALIEFNYETETRQDCFCARLVVEDCC